MYLLHLPKTFEVMISNYHYLSLLPLITGKLPVAQLKGLSACRKVVCRWSKDVTYARNTESGRKQKAE